MDTTFNTSARAMALNSLVTVASHNPLEWFYLQYIELLQNITCHIKISQVCHISVTSFQHVSTPTVFLPLCHFTKHGKTMLYSIYSEQFQFKKTKTTVILYNVRRFPFK